MEDFKNKMRDYQIIWKLKYLSSIKGKGYQNGKSYDHILPKSNEQENFFNPIRNELFNPNNGYLKGNNIKPHTGIHNLLSSWTLCANMYWPFNNDEGKILLSKWLSKQIQLDISEIVKLELEYEDPIPDLKTGLLLGENNQGMRGSGQTSPDLAVLFKTAQGKKGILLIESKFTEHSFYVCSGYQKKTLTNNIPNPDKTRCLSTTSILSSDFEDCHLNTWGRKYWNLLRLDLNKDAFKALSRCPMSTSCYQIFRQQALAKGYEKHYDVVASCVVTDERNITLVNSSKSTGMSTFPEGWKNLFPNLPFYWLTHNSWFKYVRANNSNGRWNEWIEYIGVRYDY
ncbi:MAG: hypothetical protein ABSF81_17420 [Bacteroidales bacterium]|jgi:hypothetical protein